MRRVEEALGFDPREARRALLDRTAVALADATTLRRRLVQALGEGPDASQLGIDRLLTGTDELNVNFLERGMIAADAVGRVEVRNGESDVVGSATGFMISSRLFLTNHHVLPTADDAAQSWAHFRHEFDAFGNSVEPCVFAFEPSVFFFTDAGLDVTIVAVASQTPDRRQHVARFGWLRLSGSVDTVLPGEWLSTVHHPAGRPKQVVLRQNLLMESREAELWYGTETSWASSGAPVFNDSWQVVAIHRGGAPVRDHGGHVLTVDGAPWIDGEDEARVVWRAGVGARASAIVRCLALRHGEHPLVEELLSHADADASAAIVLPLGGGAELETPSEHGSPVEEHSRHSLPTDLAGPNGAHARDPMAPAAAVTVTIPLRITVRTGNGDGREPPVGVDLS